MCLSEAGQAVSVRSLLQHILERLRLDLDRASYHQIGLELPAGRVEVFQSKQTACCTSFNQREDCAEAVFPQ